MKCGNCKELVGKHSYAKLQECLVKMIELELGNLGYPDRFLLMKAIKKSMKEMSWI